MQRPDQGSPRGIRGRDTPIGARVLSDSDGLVDRQVGPNRVARPNRRRLSAASGRFSPLMSPRISRAAAGARVRPSMAWPVVTHTLLPSYNVLTIGRPSGVIDR